MDIHKVSEHNVIYFEQRSSKCENDPQGLQGVQTFRNFFRQVFDCMFLFCETETVWRSLKTYFKWNIRVHSH